MRWLKSFVFIGLMALVTSESPNVLLRAPLIPQPLINLAVEPAIARDSVPDADAAGTPEIMAPVQTGRRQQFWPGFENSQNLYGYSPYLGGYGGYGGFGGYAGYGGYGGYPGYGGYGGYGAQIPPRPWGRRYWGPRVVLPVEATTTSPVASVETVPDVVDNTVAVETTA